MKSDIISKDKILSKANFNKIKSKFIMKKIFTNMKEIKKLDIIRFNKKLQKRLNLSINDYIKYSQKYSTIKIELKLADNKYGKFINIPDKEKDYYHIYFDNFNEEIKRNCVKKNENAKTITILIDYNVKSLKELFFKCECIKSIFFKKFYRNNITNMSRIFAGCSSLKELNLSSFNTDNVTNMIGMFSGCPSLKALNLSNFITNKVTNMSGMFEGCSSLKELNLSNFNTNKVTNMSKMFCGCLSLNELNISNFNINKVTDMRSMFEVCSSLKELNLPNFNTNKVINMVDMFYGCSFELKEKIKKQNNNIDI